MFGLKAQVGDTITSLRNKTVDGIIVPLPTKIVAETDFCYLVEHPYGGEREDYDNFNIFGGAPDTRYWAIDKDEVVSYEGSEKKSVDKVQEILEKHANYVGEENAQQVWETRKIRKIRRALERADVVRFWDVQKSGTPDVFVDANLYKINSNSPIHAVRLRLPQEEEEQEEEDKEMNMDNDNSFKNQVKSDLEKVAYRQGARKITSVSHAVILHAFRQQGFSETKLNVLLEALESAPGKALLSYGLGKGLERVMADSEVAQTLAEEFRVSGIDLGVEAGLDKLAAKGLELAPAAMGLISAIEKTTKEGLTLETLQEFSSVNSKLPKEYQDELDALEKRVRISDSDPTPEEALASELETQAEAEVQAESESEPQAINYASCS